MGVRSNARYAKTSVKNRRAGFKARGGVKSAAKRNVKNPVKSYQARAERTAARNVARKGKFTSNPKGNKTYRKATGAVYKAQTKHPGRTGAATGAAKGALNAGVKGAAIGAAAGGATKKSIGKMAVGGAISGAAAGAVGGGLKGRYGPVTKRMRRNEGWSKRGTRVVNARTGKTITRIGKFSKNDSSGLTYSQGTYKRRTASGKTITVKKGKRGRKK